MRRSIALALALSLSPALASAHEGDDAVVGAGTIEGRLLAPCCWTQTLDVHESPLADALRAEIRARLRRGESAAAIESDLVTRYGERVRAVPAGRDTRGTVPVLVGLGMLGSVVGLVFVVRRWVRRSVSPPPPAPGAPRDAWDARIDEELRALEER